MTLKEVEQAIATHKLTDALQNFELSLNYAHVNYRATFKGVAAIYEFLENQVQGFSKFGSLPTELEQVKKVFISVKANIEHLVNLQSFSPNQINENVSALLSSRPIVFLADSPETTFLLKVHSERPDLYAPSYKYLIGEISNVTTKNYLEGYFLAYEFSSKGLSDLVKRKESDQKAISTMLANFHEKIANTEKDLVDYYARSHKKFQEYVAGIDIEKEEKNKSYNNWFKQVSDQHKKFHSDSDKRIKELENLYIEKLKLEAPAKYWSDRAGKLKREGYRWLTGLVICIAAAVAVLVWILNMVADGRLEKLFSNTATAIKWSITLITLISFIAYAIRVIAKLTFSSFHLVRDAEEREQLTYVYLALKNEKGIDNTERHLIMQSLFSRAETGLLKDDGAPTMPGNIVDKFMSK